MQILAAALIGALTLSGGAVAASVTGAVGSYAADLGAEGFAKAHLQVVTSDVQACRADLAADFNFTGGLRTQAQADKEVAACLLSPGTSLAIRVLPGGYDYVLGGMSIDVPGYAAISNTATGGGVVVAKIAA
ncbi:hypothetical protein [Arthrobacter sp. 2MCAF14]|uniref:hypothetical protein n=1 Tax=Arthrobacter sp. 2MCAF14 TaxID=3232982 RepID=UPI003F903B92